MIQQAVTWSNFHGSDPADTQTQLRTWPMPFDLLDEDNGEEDDFGMDTLGLGTSAMKEKSPTQGRHVCDCEVGSFESTKVRLQWVLHKCPKA